MSHMPNRDITGHCDSGECKNTVREGEVKRQREINSASYSGPSNSVDHARSRNEQPGFLGGHV